MYPESELTLSEVVKQGAVFWSRGNAPSQRDEGLTAKELRLHFVSAYLLAEKVLASASFYFESEDTRDVTSEFSKLFHEKSVVYFVDESMDGYLEHGIRKAEKSPPELQCYHDSDLVRTSGKALNDLGAILRRPDISVSAEIERLWLADVMTDSGVLGSALVRTAETREQLLRWREAISETCRRRGDRDFVWAYLEKAFRPLDLPRQFMRVGRRRVGNLYAQATSRILGVPSDNATRLDRCTGAEARFDTSLFLECMDAIGLKEHLAKLDAGTLIRLKATVEFTTFRAFYFAVLDAAHHNAPSLKELLYFYSRVESRVAAGDSERELVVNALCQLFGKHSQARSRYRRPLDIILSVYGASGIVVIRDLYAMVAALAQPVPAETQQPATSSPSHETVSGQSHAEAPDSGKSRLIILVHGILTRAEWQGRIRHLLEADGRTIVEPLGYGYFDVIRFLFPFITRRRPIKEVEAKIRDALNLHRREHGEVIFVGHSFGTYILSTILSEQPDIRADRVLLCGSIVSRTYRWDKLPNRPKAVLNESGSRDIWPILANSVTWGYGSTGTFGFQAPGVRDRYHNLAHSDYFKPGFAEEYWVPWINEGVRKSTPYETGERPPTPFYKNLFEIVPLKWVLLTLLALAISMTILPQ